RPPHGGCRPRGCALALVQPPAMHRRAGGAAREGAAAQDSRRHDGFAATKRSMTTRDILAQLLRPLAFLVWIVGSLFGVPLALRGLGVPVGPALAIATG